MLNGKVYSREEAQKRIQAKMTLGLQMVNTDTQIDSIFGISPYSTDVHLVPEEVHCDGAVIARASGFDTIDSVSITVDDVFMSAPKRIRKMVLDNLAAYTMFAVKTGMVKDGHINFGIPVDMRAAVYYGMYTKTRPTNITLAADRHTMHRYGYDATIEMLKWINHFHFIPTKLIAARAKALKLEKEINMGVCFEYLSDGEGFAEPHSNARAQ